MTDDELKFDLISTWEFSRANKKVIAFADRLLRTEEHWKEITHICSLSPGGDTNEERQRFTAEYLRLKDAQLTVTAFSYPYFAVCGDTQLMYSRMCIAEFRAWDFRTAKKVA